MGRQKGMKDNLTFPLPHKCEIIRNMYFYIKESFLLQKLVGTNTINYKDYVFIVRCIMNNIC